jgi:quercetin dioxygenase-like cupin family protein
MIYVYKGWVRLVYEDQGQPFVLHAGDCVLQPPLIRHRVLESSPGLEVVELACPAVHDTYIDHNMELPTDSEQFDRIYGGQRFVKYIATEDKTQWQLWRLPGFEFRDIGIDAATQGLAGVKIIRSNGDIQPQACQHNAEFVFVFVLTGQLSFHIDGQMIENLTDGDAFVLPENLSYTFTDWSNDLRLLEVSLPGTFSTSFQ